MGKNIKFNCLKRLVWLKIMFIFSLFVTILSVSTTVDAAKDKKKPTIQVTPNITKPTKSNIKVKFKATDASGIKTVKWVKGSQKASYFKKKGTTVKLKKGVCTVTLKDNGTYTFYAIDKAGNTQTKKLVIKNIDRVAPEVSFSSSIMNQAATVSIDTDDKSGIASIQYLKGNVKDTASKKWNTTAKKVDESNTFIAKSDGIYSVKAIDIAGNAMIEQIDITLERRAMWISYLEFKSTGYTKTAFEERIDEMFDNCVDLQMNTVVVAVRPFADAMYPSKYFPWSKYISGTQGKDPGFDPLEYMVQAAHDRGLRFEAWLNPYRVTLDNGDYSTLATNNYARIWHDDDDESNDRNILEYDTNGNKKPNIYYNPASTAAQKLIVNGVKEIVENYEVDAIHFDDYFYPNLGKKYKTTFDYIEYNEYVTKCIDNGKEPNTIEVWRRNNVNTLLKKVHTAIKDINSDVEFGISPLGNISNLYANNNYYADIKTWLSSDKYIDYICPQIYWTFTHNTAPYDKMLDEWISYRTSSSVNIYVGIPTYRAGSNIEKEWEENDDVLQRMIEYGRDTKLVDGYYFFRYDFFYKDATQAEVENLLSIFE